MQEPASCRVNNNFSAVIPLQTYPFNPCPLHGTKDIRGNPLFRGAISRWLWRLFTHRLTRPGGWFIWLTLAFALYGSTSLDLQVFVPFTYALGVWLLAVLWANVRPPRVTLAVQCPTRVQAGGLLPITLEVRAAQAVYDATLLPEGLPPALDLVQQDDIPLGTLAAGQSRIVSLSLRCTRRGLHSLYGFRVQTDFPFGILRAYRFVPDRRTVLATPLWTPLRGMALPAGRSEQPGGAALSSARGDALEFMGNREFREGDSIRDMDWRASARLDRLVVREFHEETLHRAVLVLDTAAALDSDTGEPGAGEAALSLCAALSEFLAGRDYTVSALLAGPTLHTFDDAAPAVCHTRLVDVLAVVPVGPSAPPLSAVVPGLAACLEEASVAICLLLDWDEARRAFAERLLGQGTMLRLVVVRDTPPSRPVEADAALLGSVRLVTPAQIAQGLDFW